jgi:peptide chain release factor 1
MGGLVGGGVFSCEVLSESDSQVVLAIDGDGAKELFLGESGGHRWQRVPVTEKNGRRHSSTFTVAVMDADAVSRGGFDEHDVRFEATVGHGPGGQHRNKTATAIRATHVPSGEVVFIQSERSQQANKQRALEVLRSRVLLSKVGKEHGERNSVRKAQIGSGERSDKVRTVQEQNGRVKDHRTGKSCSVSAYLKGEIWLLR